MGSVVLVEAAELKTKHRNNRSLLSCPLLSKTGVSRFILWKQVTCSNALAFFFDHLFTSMVLIDLKKNCQKNYFFTSKYILKMTKYRKSDSLLKWQNTKSSKQNVNYFADLRPFKPAAFVLMYFSECVICDKVKLKFSLQNSVHPNSQFQIHSHELHFKTILGEFTITSSYFFRLSGRYLSP